MEDTAHPKTRMPRHTFVNMADVAILLLQSALMGRLSVQRVLVLRKGAVCLSFPLLPRSCHNHNLQMLAQAVREAAGYNLGRLDRGRRGRGQVTLLHDSGGAVMAAADTMLDVARANEAVARRPQSLFTALRARARK